jgi:CelD/BcsL family acetyltransferase involved in cellulose biosynthesis
MVECLPEEWLDFTVLTYNDAVIAYHFGFFYNNKLVWYKPAFDVKYARHSPGEVHLKYLIQHAIDLGAKEFDFTIGDENFKRRFSNEVRSTYLVRYNRKAALKLYWAVLKYLKGHLRKYGILRKLKSRIAA